MYVVDKIENNIIVLEKMEDKSILDVDISKFNKNIKVGDIVQLIDEKYVLNEEQTIKRSDYIQKLTKNLWS